MTTTKQRINAPGWRGFDDRGRQQCLTCWKWQFPAIHSCPGVPQAGRTPPPAPKRVQMSRRRPWRADHPDAVIVARPSKWGNPFKVTKFGRDEALRHYRQRLIDSPDLLAEARRELAGRDLACWCKLDHSCHGDVLLELANGGAS